MINGEILKCQNKIIETLPFFKSLHLIQALGRCGSDPEDVARAMLLQKAMVEAGASPENIAKVSREMASRAKGSLTPTAATVDALVSAIVTGGIEYDDVVKALNFDKVKFVICLVLFYLLNVYVLPGCGRRRRRCQRQRGRNERGGQGSVQQPCI